MRSENSAGEVAESEEHPFKTAVQADTPFSFAVTSETGGIGDNAIRRRLFVLPSPGGGDARPLSYCRGVLFEMLQPVEVPVRARKTQ
jgi:hypothetical protein